MKRPTMKSGHVIWLTAWAMLATPLVADGVRDESMRLIADDAKSGGKSVPKESTAKTKPKAPDYTTFDAGDPEIVALPRIEVTARKATPLDTRLAQLERASRREERASEPSWLDAILNNPVISIFGGANAKARAAEARSRVEMMDWERILILSLEEKKTPEERARILADIALLKGMEQ
jgi:hypothetical protein